MSSPTKPSKTALSLIDVCEKIAQGANLKLVVLQCPQCKRKETVDGGLHLRIGWPKCCNTTMKLLAEDTEWTLRTHIRMFAISIGACTNCFSRPSDGIYRCCQHCKELKRKYSQTIKERKRNAKRNPNKRYIHH